MTTEPSKPGARRGAAKDRRSGSTADVLALLHAEANAYPAAAYAVGLAAMLGAHLTIAGLARDPARQFYLAQAQAEVLSAALAAARTSAKEFSSKVAKMASERGVATSSMTFEMLTGESWGEIEQLARVFDIAVHAQPSGEDTPRDQSLLESVILQSGRAVIMVPHSYAGPISFERPVIAWDGSRGAARALGAAMPILHHSGEAQVITIAGQNGATSGKIPDLTSHLQRHGVACTLYEPALSQSIAKTFLNHAHEAASDLLIMGAFGHSRLREIMLGGATKDILVQADLPVLFAH